MHWTFTRMSGSLPAQVEENLPQKSEKLYTRKVRRPRANQLACMCVAANHHV